MKFYSSCTLVSVTAWFLSCEGLTPSHSYLSSARKSTAVVGALQSQWTMMPDEPAPEVGNFLLVT